MRFRNYAAATAVSVFLFAPIAAQAAPDHPCGDTGRHLRVDAKMSLAHLDPIIRTLRVQNAVRKRVAFEQSLHRLESKLALCYHAFRVRKPHLEGPMSVVLDVGAQGVTRGQLVRPTRQQKAIWKCMAPGGNALLLAPPWAQKLFTNKKATRVVVRGNEWNLIKGGALSPEQLRVLRESFQRKRNYCSGRVLVEARMSTKGRIKKAKILVDPVGDKSFRTCVQKKLDKWRPGKKARKPVQTKLAIQFTGYCDAGIAQKRPTPTKKAQTLVKP